MAGNGHGSACRRVITSFSPGLIGPDPAGRRGVGALVVAGVAEGRGGGSAPGLRRAGVSRAAAALLPQLLLVPLVGCGPQPPFPVQSLADSGQAPLPGAALKACAAKLDLPSELPRPADPSNFGERQRRDAFGRMVPHVPQLIVLHETVLSAADTVKRFATPHQIGRAHV